VTVSILPSLQRLFGRKRAATAEAAPADGESAPHQAADGAAEPVVSAASPHAGRADWWSSEMADDPRADTNVEETAPAVLYSDHLLPDLPKGKH